jgi:hypothetical protein
MRSDLNTVSCIDGRGTISRAGTSVAHPFPLDGAPAGGHRGGKIMENSAADRTLPRASEFLHSN